MAPWAACQEVHTELRPEQPETASVNWDEDLVLTRGVGQLLSRKRPVKFFQQIIHFFQGLINVNS